MIVYLECDAYMPRRAHDLDAGYDLRARTTKYIAAGESCVFDTGVHVQLPEGYVGMIKSRSGMNIKNGLQCEGVIDAGYIGSICIKLYNHGEKSVIIEAGDKIGQLVIMPIITPDLQFVASLDDFDKSERGENGFGSSGR